MKDFMKIVTTENILVDGQHKRIGSVVEVKEEDGRLLVGIGRAIEYDRDSKECMVLVEAGKKADAEEAKAGK